MINDAFLFAHTNNISIDVGNDIDNDVPPGTEHTVVSICTYQ